MSIGSPCSNSDFPSTLFGRSNVEVGHLVSAVGSSPKSRSVFAPRRCRRGESLDHAFAQVGPVELPGHPGRLAAVVRRERIKIARKIVAHRPPLATSR